MVNTGHNGDYSHPSFANAQELDAIEAEMAETRLEHEMIQSTDGRSAAEAILSTAKANSVRFGNVGPFRREMSRFSVQAWAVC